MNNGRFVSYLRVSTNDQGAKGLGIGAQREMVAAHIAKSGGTLVREIVEVESGKRNDRPALEAALDLCRRRNATLIVGKLDRLARNTRFLLAVVEGTGERGVFFCDLPHIPEGPQGKFIVTIMAANAEMEGAAISQRTKDGLAVAKGRGTKLGGRRVSAERFAEIAVIGREVSAAVRTAKASTWAADKRVDIAEVQAAGATSLREIAAALNAEGVTTAKGGSWSAVQVQRVMRG